MNILYPVLGIRLLYLRTSGSLSVAHYNLNMNNQESNDWNSSDWDSWLRLVGLGSQVPAGRQEIIKIAVNQ